MDRLEAMSIVLAVAEAGSLSAAARHLSTPAATASRKITQLGEHLRTKLFDRSARKLVLTDAGSSYVAALKRILPDISEAERAASGMVGLSADVPMYCMLSCAWVHAAASRGLNSGISSRRC